MSVREEPRSEASSTERVMEEQNSQDGVSPKQDATQPEEGGYVSLRQQGEPELLHMRFPRLPTYSLSATPSSAVTDSPWASGGEEPSESTTAPLTAVKPSTQTPKETQLPGQLRGPGRLMEAGRERVDTEQDPGPSWEKGEEVVAPASLEEVEQVEEEEGLDLEARAEEQERLGSAVPEEELGEEGQGVEALEVGKRTTLDDLAKRIRVEEITPAAGLVSILKRRGSLEGSTTPAIPKPAGKRKVRFRVPDDGLDHDEVGGDSWLLLLLLCLATVVISVGGTALYCTFGDAKSNVCTDFSHNMDFYIGQVQRGIDELRHWFSPSS
uniref:Consortin C-terminal domain-containing protein n=2 Tax=Electrophorus electricus TaxID=8005 RepID=A0A4W4FT72_ELEEL